ncbi:hypothetical protein SAMN02745823_01889 [Sporobacter termitidis DSM 10068]|uniref:Uncharacterized protein n=1 Tax=Sporobacter termitidis DSM 10068 TaxID=1123282 RepID=A0A1M5XK38_9FIRM|nr:hypothetical protein [Sporobacter termitidis]SHI00180.1 hypothetical protein SAMN02745823_01889 [Sporobacter termitidis DSM 10068]
MDFKQRVGTVTLTNTKQHPFNDSRQTIALASSLQNQDYTVITEVLDAAGDVGDVVVSDRAVNGFKLAFTGSAPRAVVRYHVMGGAAG